MAKEIDYTEEYDILEPAFRSPEEEELTMAKYHNEKAMYLYCTMERTTAQQIIDGMQVKLPLYMYELPYISKEMSANSNLRDPVTLRFAVITNTQIDRFYDQLLMPDKLVKERFKMSVEDHKKRCSYLRTLVPTKDSKFKVIMYTINDTRLLYSNPQYVD